MDSSVRLELLDGELSSAGVNPAATSIALWLKMTVSVCRVNSRVSADFGEDAEQVKKDTQLEGEMCFCIRFHRRDCCRDRGKCAVYRSRQ